MPTKKPSEDVQTRASESATARPPSPPAPMLRCRCGSEYFIGPRVVTITGDAVAPVDEVPRDLPLGYGCARCGDSGSLAYFQRRMQDG
jgi:hypothetical protein